MKPELKSTPLLWDLAKIESLNLEQCQSAVDELAARNRMRSVSVRHDPRQFQIDIWHLRRFDYLDYVVLSGDKILLYRLPVQFSALLREFYRLLSSCRPLEFPLREFPKYMQNFQTLAERGRNLLRMRGNDLLPEGSRMVGDLAWIAELPQRKTRQPGHDRSGHRPHNGCPRLSPWDSTIELAALAE